MNLQNNIGDTALSLASANGLTDTVVELLNHDKVDVNLQNKHGDTALSSASQFHGPSTIVRRSSFVFSRLTSVSRTETVIKILKHNKVDVNLKNKKWRTALSEASANGNTNTVVELLKHDKVDVTLQTKSGDTALSLASMNGHINIVWELLKHNPCETLAWATSKRQTEIGTSLDKDCANETCRADKAKHRDDLYDQLARKKRKR